MKNYPKKLLVLFVTLALSACATEQKMKVSQPAPQPVTKTTTPATPSTTTPVVEKYALERLKQMSDLLMSAKSFSYHSNGIIALQTANTGQTITYFTEAELSLQRPNKLRLQITGDAPNITLYYDGNKATAFDADKNVYAVSPKLSNVDEVLDFLLTKVKISLPSADLIHSNPYQVMTKNMGNAIIVGETMVNDVLCDHFAYTEPGIDWEIWIAKDKPLPLRLAMTYRQLEEAPRFIIDFLDWQINPTIDNQAFVFKKTADAKQIEFGTHQEK